jgi:membrane protein required for colicin V production
MPIIDIIISVALVASIIVGFVRGFVRESISIATLVVAIWASLHFGPGVWGALLIFGVVLAVGGLIGWGVSKLVRLSVLSGIDRLMGSLFGVLRGILLVALFVMGGQFFGFDNEDWWRQSRLGPHFEVVADWIKVMAPVGYEIIVPDEVADELPAYLPMEL